MIYIEKVLNGDINVIDVQIYRITHRAHMLRLNKEFLAPQFLF